MGLDKLKLLTPRRPTAGFFDEVNAEYRLPPDQRPHFVFGRVRDSYSRESGISRIHQWSEVAFNTRSKIVPWFRVELNYMAPGGKQPPLTTLEINPNKFPDGWLGVRRLVDRIFSDDCEDLKVSRIDLNADVEDLAAEYFRSALRIPAKRKSADMGQTWKSKGVQTFYIGKPPAQLRVYDKIQELQYQGEDVSRFPRVLTRLEWEYRHDHCPVKLFSDLPLLEQAHPFMGLELLDNCEYYDFKTDPKESVKRLTFKALADRLGVQDAVRILNADRHFSRDFKHRRIVLDNADVKRRIHQAYVESTRRFFENKGADVRFTYAQSQIPAANVGAEMPSTQEGVWLTTRT